MKIIKIFSIVLYFLLLGCFIIPSTQASIAGDNILITEVLYDTPGTDSDEEWIELFNPTVAEINVTNWIIGDNVDNYTIPLAVIPSGGYLTIARVAAGFNALYTYDPDIEGLTLYLGNSGDKLTLYDESDVIIDFVAWENYVEGWTIGAQYTTIRRINSTDTDTVDDWENSLTTGDPGFGDYVLIIPELPQSLASIFLVLTGIATIVGLSYRKKRIR